MQQFLAALKNGRWVEKPLYWNGTLNFDGHFHLCRAGAALQRLKLGSLNDEGKELGCLFFITIMELVW